MAAGFVAAVAAAQALLAAPAVFEAGPDECPTLTPFTAICVLGRPQSSPQSLLTPQSPSFSGMCGRARGVKDELVTFGQLQKVAGFPDPPSMPKPRLPSLPWEGPLLSQGRRGAAAGGLVPARAVPQPRPSGAAASVSPVCTAAEDTAAEQRANTRRWPRCEGGQVPPGWVFPFPAGFCCSSLSGVRLAPPTGPSAMRLR